jgi:branched-chain amino acid transport system substrate-binding protein
MNHKKAILFLVFFLVGQSKVCAEDGVTPTEIKLGSSGAITGTNGHWTKEISQGINACFARINRAGGINGRKLKLSLKDDGYEPNQALLNTKDLVENQKVFAMIGGNGTAAANAVLPYLSSHEIPNLFRFSGGEILYSPFNQWTFQTRLSYHEEASRLIAFAVENLKLKKIAVFYQDDAFGASGRNGVAEALAKYNLKIISQASIARNTFDAKSATEQILNEKPDAVYFQVIMGAAEAFIKEANLKGFRPTYLGSSPVEADMMSKSDKKENEIYMAEVVPAATDTSLSVVRKYQADMKAIGETKFDRRSLEGYIAASVFEEAVRRIGKKNLTRLELAHTFEGMKNYDLGDILISFSPENHTGLSKIFLNYIHQGKSSSVNP